MFAGGTGTTCPTLARRVTAPGDVGRQLCSLVTTAARRATVLLLRLRDGDSTPAQLTRFALAGGLATVVQATLFSLVAPVGIMPANVVAWAASTALANELHRRRTFRAGGQVGRLAAQCEGAGLALVGLLATSGTLALFTVAAPEAGLRAQTGAVLAVTAAVGTARFLALRWSFVIRRARAA